MPFEVRVLTVLIASPGDVSSARDAIERELHEWNGTHSMAKRLTLQPRRWEIDGVPVLGRGDAQSVLNQQLVDEADIVIAVFHTRLGSPTPRAASGTAEEIERASAAGKQVHVWFSEESLPHSLDVAQFAALTSFRKVLQARHYVGSYASAEDLQAKVRRAVNYDVAHIEGERGVPNTKAAELRPKRQGTRSISQQSYFRSVDGISTMVRRVARTLGPAATGLEDVLSIVQIPQLPDPDEEHGAQLVRDLVARTREECGDGAATAGVLAGGVVERLRDAVQDGVDPWRLYSGLKSDIKKVAEALEATSIEVESKEQLVAIVLGMTGNGDYGRIIADAFDGVGAEGHIIVEADAEVGLHLDLDEAMHFEGGYASERFSYGRDNNEVRLDNPYVVVLDSSVTRVEHVLPLMEQVVKTGGSLALFAPSVEGSALDILVTNALRQHPASVAVVPNTRDAHIRELLEDVAVFTGGEVISEGFSLRSFDLSSAGRAGHIAATGSLTRVLGGAANWNRISTRINHLRSRLRTSELGDRALLQTRVANLGGGHATIRIGQSDELDAQQEVRLLARTVDATRVAIKTGLVPGGGWAFIKVQDTLRKFGPASHPGGSTLIDSLHVPASRILSNSGHDVAAVVAEMRNNVEDGVVFDSALRRPVKALPAALVDARGVLVSGLMNAAKMAEAHLELAL